MHFCRQSTRGLSPHIQLVTHVGTADAIGFGASPNANSRRNLHSDGCRLRLFVAGISIEISAC
jgi:hypothetical protein